MKKAGKSLAHPIFSRDGQFTWSREKEKGIRAMRYKSHRPRDLSRKCPRKTRARSLAHTLIKSSFRFCPVVTNVLNSLSLTLSLSFFVKKLRRISALDLESQNSVSLFLCPRPTIQNCFFFTTRFSYSPVFCMPRICHCCGFIITRESHRWIRTVEVA